VPRRGSRERGDKRWLTERENAAAIDFYVMSCAAHVFARDEHFLACVEKTRENPEVADSLACRYVRYGLGRAAIARMLRTAADCEPRMVETVLANLGDMTVWPDLPLEAGDAERERERDRYRRGAELLANRGARRCLRCGAPNIRGYCDYREAPQSIRDSDTWTIKVTVGALAEAVGFEANAGPRARRTRRSSERAVAVSSGRRPS